MLRTLLTWLPGGDENTYDTVWFEFGLPVLPTIAAGLLLILFGLALLFWWCRLRTVRGWRRAAIALMRATALTLLLCLLLDPVLVGRRTEPGKHFVLLLVDDSRSMQIPDGGQMIRSEMFMQAYSASEMQFERTLMESHQVVLFRFGQELARMRDVQDLLFEQRQSDLIGAINSALKRMSGANVSAVILFSDGVQQSVEPVMPESTLTGSVPVFTVGTGMETEWRSLELASLAVGRSNFDRSPVTVTARVLAEGLTGEEVSVEILDAHRVVESTSFTVTQDRGETSIRLEFIPKQQGWGSYQARVRLAGQEPGDELAGTAKDPIPENNVREFAVGNRERTYRILYFVGRPAWEVKFMRRALEAEPQFSLSSLIRISGPERKFVFRGADASMSNPLFEGFDDNARLAPRYDEAVFLRIGTQGSELATGYPSEAERLFQYHLVIWGDIERDFFSTKQLELTRDFVSRRGGSFLIMGGPTTFAAKGYQDSVIEPMLPVVLTPQGESLETLFAAEPTVEGTLSGVWSLASEAQLNRDIWASIPELYGLNRFASTRVGSTVLAEGIIDSAPDARSPLFAWQRYGEGRCAVLATGETWQWQMMRSLEDTVHERFWRQLVRALVEGVPEPIVLTNGDQERITDEAQPLTFLIRDPLFVAREGLTTQATVTAPDGNEWSLPVEESLEETGVYSAELLPDSPGLHQLQLTAQDAEGNTVGQTATAVMVHEDHRESQNARYNPEYLQQIANVTGGKFFTLAELDRLAREIPWTDTENQRTDRYHLWHFFPFYLLVVVLFSVEWYLRRKQGLP